MKKTSYHAGVYTCTLWFLALRMTKNSILALHIVFSLHTHRITLLFCLLQYTSVLLSLSLSICSAESCDHERVYTSPLHLPWDNAVEEGRKRKGGESGLVLSLFLFFFFFSAHTHTLKPPSRQQQQLLAMTANCFPCTYLWHATDCKVLSLLHLRA